MFNRNTRAIRGVRTDLNQLRDNVLQIAHILETVGESLEIKGSQMTELEGHIIALKTAFQAVQSGERSLRKDVDSLHIYPLFLGMVPTRRPLTGIRRELCPTA